MSSDSDNDENDVVIEALRVCPDVVGKDDGLVGDRVFC